MNFSLRGKWIRLRGTNSVDTMRAHKGQEGIAARTVQRCPVSHNMRSPPHCCVASSAIKSGSSDRLIRETCCQRRRTPFFDRLVRETCCQRRRTPFLDRLIRKTCCQRRRTPFLDRLIVRSEIPAVNGDVLPSVMDFARAILR